MANVIIRRPQFNTTKLKPGTFVKVTTRSGYYINGWHYMKKNALVIRSSPLKLDLVMVTDVESENRSEIVSITINVNEIISRDVLIEFGEDLDEIFGGLRAKT